MHPVPDLVHVVQYLCTNCVVGCIHSSSLLLLSSTSSVSVAAVSTSLVYVLVVLLETSCHPYDVLEAEPEVVSGYYVDYGGYVFMVLYLAEGVVLYVLSW